MKKTLVVSIILLFVAGCSFDLMTEDNPLGARDPNQFIAFFEFGRMAAQGAQATGAATANPLLYAIGSLVLLVVGGFGSKYLINPKKE